MWEDVDSDDELDESVCYDSEINSPELNKEQEARMIEKMRHIRRDYENNSRLMRGECILTREVLKTDNENVIMPKNQICKGNDAKKEINLHNWYISLTNHLSVIVIGKR